MEAPSSRQASVAERAVTCSNVRRVSAADNVALGSRSSKQAEAWSLRCYTSAAIGSWHCSVTS